MKQPDKLTAALDQLWQKHLPVTRSRIETIQMAVNAIHSNRLTADLCRKAQQSAHNLAGLLGAYGLEQATSDALEIERWLADPLPANGIVALDKHLAQLSQAIESRGRKHDTMEHA